MSTLAMDPGPGRARGRARDPGPSHPGKNPPAKPPPEKISTFFYEFMGCLECDSEQLSKFKIAPQAKPL